MSREKIDAALVRLLDGEPEPGDGELLADAMRNDAALRREVSGLLAVDELLRQNAELSADDFTEAFAERLTDDTDQEFVSRIHHALPNRPSRWSRWPLAAAAALVASFGAFFFTRAPKMEVAMLLLAEKCEWQQPESIQEGRRLAPGPLRLRQGLAMLRFDGGAELILRGETEVEIQSASQVRLVRGDVTVRAAEDAAGFKLLTPASEVVDLGTEFAAKVERSGATELYVLEGEIAVNPARANGGRGEVLHAGKAVRFDSAAGSKSREVEMRADRFEAIVRAANPASRADLMSAYEGFSYQPGRLSFAEGKGGLGWRGTWRAAKPAEAYRPTEEPVSELSIAPGEVGVPWLSPGTGPGMLELPAGIRTIVRPLAQPVTLDKDGVTYFSFLVREPDSQTPQAAGVRLVLRSSANPADLLSFGPARGTRRPGIRTGDGPNFTGPMQIALNQNTLWIGKIVARRDGEDEVFFSIYGEHDTLSYAEPVTWQTASRRLRKNGHLDLVMISTSLSAPCAVDELRIGPTWRSIAPMQEIAKAP